jgi:hypothetical protein
MGICNIVDVHSVCVSNNHDTTSSRYVTGCQRITVNFRMSEPQMLEQEDVSVKGRCKEVRQQVNCG